MTRRARHTASWFGISVAAIVTASCGGSPSQPSSSAGAGGQLDAAYAQARQLPSVTSLVVARDGIVVREEYFSGGGSNVPQDVRSVTKSVVSLLVGIALERGCLSSIDRPIGDLLGPLAPTDPAKAPVTARQLLTMTSGIGGDELADLNEYNRWAAAANQLAYVWDLPVQAPPGSRFAYFSPAYSVLSPILEQGCGGSTIEFARQTLFTALGVGWREWELDHQGHANGAAGLRLTPMDMIAIGNLVLSDGRAGGQQVVPSAWVRDATRVQVATSAQRYDTGYGFGWWIGRASGSDLVFANGYGGQFIVVVPRSRLVVAATSRWEGVARTTANAEWSGLIDVIMQWIVPAF